MTRKTQFLVPAAAALVGLAVVTALWLHHGAAPDNPAPQPEPPPSAVAEPGPNNEPPDPQVMGQIRDAYQKSLAEGAPPGMIELMQGPGGGQPGDLPPLPDPFVVPAGHHGDSSPDLPPLPAVPAGKPKPLPPIDPAPAADKMPKEGPSPDLPPLPK